MKNIYLIIFISFIIGCTTEKKAIVLDKTKPQHIKVKLDTFNGIIEDFENGLTYWNKKSIDKNFINLYIADNPIQNLINDKKIGVINYNIGYSTDYYKTYAIVEYYKKMNFSKYKGVQFTARGNDNVVFRFKIYEMEEYKPGENIKEVWYTDFKATEEWTEFKLPFSSMQVEEYWEQNYVSDNQQIFTNIAGIAISVKNTRTPEYISGNLYIDNIKLY